MSIFPRKYHNEIYPQDLILVHKNGRLAPDWDTYYAKHFPHRGQAAQVGLTHEAVTAIEAVCQSVIYLSEDERIADDVFEYSCELMNAQTHP